MIGDNLNNKGFTLIEMVVAIALFTLLMTATSGLFVSSIKAQRQSLAMQEIQSQTSYLMEYMYKALRMARKDTTGLCTGTVNLNYAFNNQCLKFNNYNGVCQQFCLANGRIKDENEVYLTSPNLTINSFNVNLLGEMQPPDDNKQPRITFFLEIQGKENSNIKIQTTISQRNPDVRN